MKFCSESLLLFIIACLSVESGSPEPSLHVIAISIIFFYAALIMYII